MMQNSENMYPHDRLHSFARRRIERLEMAQLKAALTPLSGYQLMQLGQAVDVMNVPGVVDAFVRKATIGWSLGCSPDVLAAPHQLPLVSDSVDVLVAPHLLEFHDQPHDILREAHRVLRPEGHIVLSGFSPFSLLGLARPLNRLRPAAQRPTTRWLSATRVGDWLSLLGFELSANTSVAIRVDRSDWTMRDSWRKARPALERFAGVYTLVGRKKVMWVRPIVSRWRPRRRVVGGAIAEPSVRAVSRDGLEHE